MDEKKIICNTADFVRRKLENEGSGHDWWHIERVRKNALEIAKEERVNLFIVELAALLHDIADWKSHDEKEASKIIQEWLRRQYVDDGKIKQVCDIVENISFKGKDNKKLMQTEEGKVVQDADRLDALGAVGIARSFTYGGNKNREIFNPEIKPSYGSYVEKAKGMEKNTSINHFYEKLLLLKDLMNTKTGKKLAEERHNFMIAYLNEFYKEIGIDEKDFIKDLK